MKSADLKNFIIDIDGVMTNGQMLYTKNGKYIKIFGPDDSDMLSIMKNYINIYFITADKKGYPISKKRIVKDMGFKLYYVNILDRVEWIDKKFNLNQTIYMGDSIFDSIVIKNVTLGIVPQNADNHAKKFAKLITRSNGGDRAVSEACVFILKKFFKIDFFKLLTSRNNFNKK